MPEADTSATRVTCAEATTPVYECSPESSRTLSCAAARETTVPCASYPRRSGPDPGAAGTPFVGVVDVMTAAASRPRAATASTGTDLAAAFSAGPVAPPVLRVQASRKLTSSSQPRGDSHELGATLLLATSLVPAQ